MELSREHLDSLQTEIGAINAAFKKDELFDIVQDNDPDSGYSIFRLRQLKPIPTARLGVLVGDVVHQARSAFDNLIEALNIREVGHATPNTEFPIYENENVFLRGRTERGKRRIRPASDKMGRISAEAVEIIKELQPYHRGDDYTSHPLWILHHLWIMDKHRNPSVVASIGQNTGNIKPRIRSADGRPATVSIHEIIAPEFFPFEDGAEICRIRWNRTPNLEMEVHQEMTLYIALRHDQPGGRHPLEPMLRECVAYAAGALARFEPFFM